MTTSKQWLQEHFSDQYVKKAKQEGYLSRAAYKLLDIQKKYSIFKPGQLIIDLGAAPGGWSQVAKKLVGLTGTVIAVDLLPISLSNIIFIQGDLTHPTTLDALLKEIQQHTKTNQCDVVLSDMAPNLSGQREIDQPKSLYLAEIAWDCAQELLKPGGHFVVKLFEGSGTQEWIRQLRTFFKSVKIYKPPASRARSSEIYLIGINKKITV